jgi:NAD(P)-dependent dehydrogenase (short-subunit alcohol dehydrogenase family)
MQANSYALTDKQILVTGASSGLGSATACACAEGGAHVILSGRNEEKLLQVMQQLSGIGHQSFPLDLCKAEDLDAFCESLPELDGICFAAGITRTIVVKRIKSTDIEDIFNTNLISSIKIVNQLVKMKKLKKNASIVFIASISSSYADIGNSVYAATKGGVISFARCLALELASKGIRVNCVSPGFVAGTGMTEGLSRLSEDQIKLEQSKYPLGFGEPSDIANGIVYLLSDAAKWVTGITLTIDGGITLK